MIVTCVTVHVLPEHVEDFIRATRQNHLGSIGERDNLRFDLLQSEEDETRFLLYEAYASEEAAAQHKTTSHYAAWRDAVAPWMAQPRQAARHRILAPHRRELW